MQEMSMTRDIYAKEVAKAAESAFNREETTHCPHENCDERLSVVKQGTFSTRSLFCPVHGHIFQEQKLDMSHQLDWEAAEERLKTNDSKFNINDQDDLED